MAVIFRRCSGVCCLGWAISPPSGLSLIGSAAWFGRYCTRGAIARGVRFIEKKRAQMLARALRKLGYEVAITPINPVTAANGLQM
jgi:hypothetical protein